MKIGLIADTHDNTDGIRLALKIFQQERVERIYHLGDLCQPETVWEFADTPSAFIRGNNELELVRLVRTFKSAGLDYLGEQAAVQANGRSLCLYHGTRPTTLQKLIDSQQFDYVLKGHSHSIEDYTVGRTRILNPGAAWRSRSRSVALLDTLSDSFQVMELK